MANEIPPWGRAHRRIERAAARELAKTLISERYKPKKFTWDITLGCVVGVIGIVLIIAPPQSRLAMVGWLVVMLVFGIYPLFHLIEWLPVTEWIGKTIGILGLTAIIMALGFENWPPVTRHHLSQREWTKFEEPLKVQQKGEHEEIQIVCPAADEITCVYAEQFINIFRDAGWTVQNNEVQRVTLARPPAGIMLFKHSDGTPDPKDWRSGTWARVSPGLLSVYQAFVNIGMEPNEETRKDISEGVMTIYFGTAKADEGEPTDLTKMMKQLTSQKVPGKL